MPGKEYKVIVVDKDDPVLVVQRFGWEEIALAIAESLAEQIGAAIFDKLTGTNYQQLNKDVVYTFARIVRQEIDAAALAECDSRIQALETEVKEYRADPANNEFQLLDAITESNRLVTRLQSLGLPGVGSFMIAAGLRLAVLEERAKKFPAQYQVVKDRAKEYADYAESTLQPIRDAVAVRFTDCQCIPDISPGAPWGRKICYYTLDGEGGPSRGFKGFGAQVEGDCKRAHDSEKAALLADVDAKQIATIEETARRWRQL